MNVIGKVQIYTGNGKGKTTAAVGSAFRAAGRGLKVLIIQFLKEPDSSGEHFAATKLEPLVTIKPMGCNGFIHCRGGDPLDRIMAENALEEARKALVTGQYDMIILDEVNCAVHFGLIAVEDVVKLLDSKPEQVELILTGRYARQELIDRGDVVVEMKKIKHHYDNGVGAREGIEY
ncbi:MAG: cob(I)yrinic acid a,c-diamide adenosyltransferase [Desulfomonilaceae bacterium]|nr:cob(I)yrinic acid a,c-diamide adenosyltransferase [Desulfomonilaceae bacterium]